MTAPFYFVPGCSVVRAEDLDRLGLSHAFAPSRGRGPSSTAVQSGPGDVGRGALVAPPSVPVDRVRITDDDRQVWAPFPNQGASETPPLWVGYWAAEPPTPDEVVRPDPLPGHAVELADDRLWTIPVARRFTPNAAEKWASAIPRRCTLNGSGEWVFGAVLERHAELWEAAERYWDLFSSAVLAREDHADGDAVEIRLPELLDGACTAIAANYYLSRAEIGLLGLLDETAAARVMHALIDGPALTRYTSAAEAADPKDRGGPLR